MAKKRQKKTDWMKKRRQNYLEQRQYRYYLFCEGEKTESNYFWGFQKRIEENPVYRDMVLIEIRPCGAETLRVVDEAENYVKKNAVSRGQVWCIYDKDDFPADHFNAAANKVENLNKGNSEVEYHAAWSNECIEFWFVLHFANYISNNHRSEYVAFLNERSHELGYGSYQKNMPDIFDILMEKGNPKLAIRYAEKNIRNSIGKTPADIAPGTKVHELVKDLAKYLPETQKTKFM